MSPCLSCGKPVKPWYDLCYECCLVKNRSGSGKFAEPIKAQEFMKKMGIGGWQT